MWLAASSLSCLTFGSLAGLEGRFSTMARSHPKIFNPKYVSLIMNYQRIYLLSALGIGIIFTATSVPELLETPSLTIILLSIGGVGMVLSSVYSLVFVDDPTGPTSPNWLFFSAVGGFILALVGIAISILP